MTFTCGCGDTYTEPTARYHSWQDDVCIECNMKKAECEHDVRFVNFYCESDSVCSVCEYVCRHDFGLGADSVCELCKQRIQVS